MRNFRDNMVLRTNAGSSFMTLFNAWYYSFSPNVAGFITQHQTLRMPMKYILYPLVLILRIGAGTFSLISSNPEAAAIASGIVISWLLGSVYLAAPLSALLSKSSRGRRIARRLERALMIMVPVALGAIAGAELLGATSALMFLASGLVLAVIALSAFVMSRAFLSVWGRLNGRRAA
jgi:hypothetical protein